MSSEAGAQDRRTGDSMPEMGHIQVDSLDLHKVIQTERGADLEGVRASVDGGSEMGVIRKIQDKNYLEFIA